MTEKRDHFQGKGPLRHVVEAKMSGVETSLEIHGAETPGILFSGLDSARETLIALGILILSLDFFEFSKQGVVAIITSWTVAWSFWKGARSTWLSWMRLERLHRIAREEKKEIEENREEEREELIALYKAKGFQGELLSQVVDVLMADEERLLRVMLQEEMGFKLNENQHPLLMGLGAFFGALLTGLAVIGVVALSPRLLFPVVIAGSFVLGFYYSLREKNNALQGATWSAMIAATTLVILSGALSMILH